MDIRTDKLWLIEQIARITDEKVISTLKSLLEIVSQPTKAAADKDFWDELSVAQRQQIDKAIHQLDDGEGIPHEAVMTEFRSKYRLAK